MAKLDKKLLWVQPYLKEVSNLIPLESLKELKGYYVYETQGVARQEGQTIRNKSNKYTITLRLNRGDAGLIFMYDFLHTLAHELAHLKYFEHDYKHIKLTCKIFSKFAKVLKEQGITDTYQRITINE